MQKILIVALAFLIQTNSAWAGFFSFDWEDAGFTKEEKQAYTACNINLGVERVYRDGRRSYSVMNDGAWSWKYAGFTAEEACIFRQAGVTNAFATSIYQSCGLSTEDIIEITKSPLFLNDFNDSGNVYYNVYNEPEKLEKGQLTVRDINMHGYYNGQKILFQAAHDIYYDSKECKALKAYKDAGFALSGLNDWSYKKYGFAFSIYEILGFKKNELDQDHALKLVDEIRGCTTDCPERIASLVTAERNQMEERTAEINKKKPFLKMGFDEDEVAWLINHYFDPSSVNKLPCAIKAFTSGLPVNSSRRYYAASFSTTSFSKTYC